uniref:hypothetical protein n=1 Tax=Nocardia araoensis TaxID=228600 RepID=UPI0002E53F6B|nr:hypothetical protein [Nocardia araoensis]
MSTTTAAQKAGAAYTFTLAKVVRDQHEAATVHGRIDQARMEKLLSEHDPFNSVA